MTNQAEVLKIWRLSPGTDRRFRAGHPWAYSNEIMGGPKGLEPGALVELQDASGKFLARGYGNPHSLISFRTLSRNPAHRDLTSTPALVAALDRANSLRIAVGLKAVSYRLCFGEADFLPGLVIDRFQTISGQVFVVQAHTAGAQMWVPRILEVLEQFVEKQKTNWNQTAVVLRNDLNVRKLEGLDYEEPQILKSMSGANLESIQILVAAALGGEPLPFWVDLVQGQKTGFFLDQAANIQLAALRLKHLAEHLKIKSKSSSNSSDPIRFRVLDLCCYVGQWSTQFARVFRDAGIETEILLVDASQQALELARKNVELQGARCEILRGDVLKDLTQLTDRSFDLVISDPPALIKSRKDIPAGTHAYLQLATQVFRLVKLGGGVVTCSCSALLEEESFSQTLTKAAGRNGVSPQWIGRGAQSPDHPFLTEFPEGRYLKGWVGIVN